MIKRNRPSCLLFAGILLALACPAARAQQEPAEPVVPHVAAVRLSTRAFDTDLDGRLLSFPDSTLFRGRVMWLDDQTLWLQVDRRQPDLKIPLDAVTSFEMVTEKAVWPVTTFPFAGILIGAVHPVSSAATHPWIPRFSNMAIGAVAGLVSGMIFRHYLPAPWVSVPLARLRLGIKK